MHRYLCMRRSIKKRLSRHWRESQGVELLLQHLEFMKGSIDYNLLKKMFRIQTQRSKLLSRVFCMKNLKQILIRWAYRVVVQMRVFRRLLIKKEFSMCSIMSLKIWHSFISRGNSFHLIIRHKQVKMITVIKSKCQSQEAHLWESHKFQKELYPKRLTT